VARSLAVASLLATSIAFGACVDEERPPPSANVTPAGPSSGAGVGMTDTVGGGGGAGGAAGGAGGVGNTGGSGTGGAIEPGSNCDDSGACDTCINCSLLGDCTAANIDCNNDPTCETALMCFSNCVSSSNGDASSYANCASVCDATQVGASLANVLINCTCYTSCPKDCAAEQPFDCIQQLY